MLETLAKISYPHFTVFLVDNASTDGTSEAVMSLYPDVNLLRNNENLGGAGGFNTGIEQIIAQEKFEFVWLLDNDVEVDPMSLTYLLETLSNNPNAAVCGSRIARAGTNVIQECGGYIDWHRCDTRLNRRDEIDDPILDLIEQVDFCPACSMLVRIEDIKKFGSFDSEMFVFWDDIEFCTRLKNQGRTILCDLRSRVVHSFHGDKPEEPWRIYYYIRNALYFIYYHYPNKNKNKGVSKYLYIAYQKLMLYKLLGANELAAAVHIGIHDFFKGIRGRQDIETMLRKNSKIDEGRNEDLNGIDMIIQIGHKSSETIESKIKACKIFIWKKTLSLPAKIKIIIKIITKKSIIISNRVHIIMLFSKINCLVKTNGYVLSNNRKRNALLYIINLIRLRYKYCCGRYPNVTISQKKL